MATIRQPTKTIVHNSNIQLPKVNFDRRKADELGHKIEARLFMLWAGWNHVKIAYPSRSEWIGINLLERDGEAPYSPKKE